MSDLKNILQDDDRPISEEALKLYLEGKLHGDALHEVERKIADSSFMNDAVEGLQHIHTSKDLDRYVHDLKGHLQKQLAEKKHRERDRSIKNLPQILFAVVLILLLCILGYIVLNMYYDRS